MGFLHGGGGSSNSGSRSAPPRQYERTDRTSLCPHCGKDVNEPPKKRETTVDNDKKAIIQNYLDTLSRSGNLTKWEEEFVDSVSEQFERRGTLSDKQIGTLEKIYGEKC